MSSGVFSITAISCGPVIRWAYQHSALAVEVKNFAKITFLSFNATAVFLHDVMVPENDFLKRGSAVGVFSWVTLSSDCRFQTFNCKQSE